MPHRPGSPPALSQGCKCSPRQNRNGEGACTTQGGEVRYVVAKTCPLHGEAREKKRDRRSA